MNRIIKIGVMGCANIATRSVIPAILDLNDKYKLVAIASRDKAKANLCAKQFGCKGIEGYQNLLDRNDIDAIYMPLPTGLHHEWIIKALKMKKHVYAEKSIARNYSEADEIVLLAMANNLALMEGYMFQYHSQHDIVFDLLRNNAIGEPRNFRASFGFPPLPDNDFRYNDVIGGGALLDAAGYPLRATFFIMGDEFEVKSANLFFDTTKRTNIFGSAVLNGNNGISSQIAFGFDNYYQCNYEIWGSKGKITVERAFTPKPDFSPSILLENADGKNTIIAEADDHFKKALLEFYDVVIKDKKAKHYKEILQQSNALEKIKEFGLPKYS